MRRGLKRDGFAEQPHNRARGDLGEKEGVAWLEEQGYRVVERNVVNKIGEIDVIAWEGSTFCFVEIKARSTDAYGPAIAAVTAAKQRKLARTAGLYLAHNPVQAPCRFDVLGMDMGQKGWIYTLIRDAFAVG